MTALAAVLMIGGLLFAILFVVGTFVFFGMLIHAEWSHARTHRAEKTVTVPEPHALPAHSAPELSKLTA